MTTIQFIQNQTNIAVKSIEATIQLLSEDCTIPFISRYRKDQTGNLDEVQIETISKLNKQFIEIVKRKESILKSIEEAAILAGYSLLITQTQESYERELINIQNLSRGQVEGIIISLSRETVNLDHLTRLQRRGIPLVFFDRDSDEIHASKVMVDNEQSAYEAVKHLLLAGCKRIAFLAGPKNVSVSNQRISGYLRALAESGVKEDLKLIIHSDYIQDSATLCTQELMKDKNRPDGILVVSDRLALGVLVALRGLNISVPEEVKIVSFNNEPICSIVSPSISSVSQPLEEIGRLSVELLLDQINHKGEDLKPRVEVLKTQLMVRESSSKRN